MYKSIDRRNPLAFLSRLVVLFSLVLTACATAPVTKAQANSKYAGIVLDARTGKTLYKYNADSRRYPASLTKMMTLYMVFDAMKRGKISKSTRIRVSSHAASMVPSKLYIKAGGSLTAEQAILALVTKSANDVAAAVAEHLGGTESQFAVMMTRKARQLGMSKTTFKNASGLSHSGQVTTARDMARLGIALKEHFPREFKYFSTTKFRFGKSTFGNHNKLLGKVSGVNGIKTGYTRASGYNLVTSVDKKGRRIVAVVLGGRTGASRNAQMVKLINGYLGKASRRGGGNLIAKAPGTGFASPQTASIAAMPASKLPRPSLAARNVPAAPVQLAAKPAAPATNGSAPAAVAYAPVPRPKVGVQDAITTASTASRSGWVIQIAALESQGEALDYLSNAQTKARPILGGRDPFIEVFKKGSTTYHRARFAGFSSKSDAWGACSDLKKYQYDCMAYKK